MSNPITSCTHAMVLLNSDLIDGELKHTWRCRYCNAPFHPHPATDVLRDQFAGMAMSGMLASATDLRGLSRSQIENFIPLVAQASYVHADAMLEVRSKCREPEKGQS